MHFVTFFFNSVHMNNLYIHTHQIFVLEKKEKRRETKYANQIFWNLHSLNLLPLPSLLPLVYCHIIAFYSTLLSPLLQPTILCIKSFLPSSVSAAHAGWTCDTNNMATISSAVQRHHRVPFKGRCSPVLWVNVWLHNNTFKQISDEVQSHLSAWFLLLCFLLFLLHSLFLFIARINLLSRCVYNYSGSALVFGLYCTCPHAQDAEGERCLQLEPCCCLCDEEKVGLSSC